MRKSYSRPVTLLKRDSTQVFSSELSEIFKNNYFEKDLRTTASENLTSGSSFFALHVTAIPGGAFIVQQILVFILNL